MTVRFVPLVIVLLAAALRLYGLGSKSLWGDEIAQAVWSAWDWGRLWQEFRAPPDFLSHFLLVHLAQLAGRGEFWTRLPSAVTSLLAVPLTYVVAKRLTDRQSALAAMLLMAVAPYQVWYAQEARMYSALACYALLGLYFFLRIVQAKEEKREQTGWIWVVGLVVGNTLAVYTHLFGVFPVLAEGVAALGLLISGWITDKQGRLPRWAILLAIGFVGTFVLALPLVPGTLPYLMQGGTPAVAESILVTLPFRLTLLLLWEFLGDLGLGARESWRTVLCAALGLIGLVALARRKPRAAWIAGVYLALPLMVLALVQPRHAVSARYLIFLQPVYLVVVAYAVVEGARLAFGAMNRLSKTGEGRRTFTPATIGIVVVGLLVLWLIVGPPLAALYPRAKLNDWRALARFIEDNGRAGDLVFGERNTPNMNALAYYFPNLLRYTTPPTTLETLQRALDENRRIWYVSVGEFFDPPGEEWARENLQVIFSSAWQEPTFEYAPESEFVFTQSEHPATLLYHEGVLPSEISYEGRQGFSNENIDRLRMNPGEMLDVELQARATGARQLEIEFSSKRAARFDVLVNGEVIAQVREAEKDRGAEIMQWDVAAGGESLAVRVVNASDESPLFIRWVALKAAQ